MINDANDVWGQSESTSTTAFERPTHSGCSSATFALALPEPGDPCRSMRRVGFNDPNGRDEASMLDLSHSLAVQI